MSENKEVFISYHTDSAKNMVESISGILEANSISCWYAPRDIDENAYADSIVKAIRQCKVFLLILNEYSNLSGHVLNEINCAFDRFKNNEEITLLPFRVDSCTLSDGIYYYLGRIHIMDGSTPPELVRIQELVDRISVILGKSAKRTFVIDSENKPVSFNSNIDIHTAVSKRSNKTYRLISDMVYPDAHFVGRKKEMANMYTALSGTINKIFLVGMGGIGKSELAKSYIKQHASDYDVVLWISYSESLLQAINSDFTFSIEGINRSDYPEDTDMDYFRRKLKILKTIADRRVLIVIDNFDVSDDEMLETFLDGGYSVIFTTRYRHSNSNIPEIEILPISEQEDLMELFKIEYKRDLDKESEKSVEKILELLEGHPLNIRLVASAMQSRRMKPEKMLELLEAGSIAMMQENAKAADMIYGRLRQVFQLSTLNEAESSLLKILSLVSLRGIEVEQLFEWCERDDFETIDGLIDKSWIIHNPATDEVHLHPLISELSKELLMKDLSCCDVYIRNMIRLCHETKNMKWQRIYNLYEQVKTAYKILPHDYKLQNQLAEEYGTIAMDLHHHDDSLEVFTRLLEESADIGKKLFYYHKVSHVQVLSEKAAQSIATAKEGYELVKTIDLEQYPVDVIYMKKVLLQRIGEASRALGNYEEAIAYGKMAVEICDQYDFKDPELSKGWAYYHLASSYCYAKQYKNAKTEIDHAIKLFESIQDKWSLAYSYLINSRIYLGFEEFAKAMEYAEKAWKIQLPHCSADSVEYGEYLELSGDILKETGDTVQAESRYWQALMLFDKFHISSYAERVKQKLEKA